jgi:DNA repair exonuclease SbcCD ATPase subunit
MRIVSVFVENIKRVKLISYIANKGMNIISGKNNQGKSSFLDAIMYALAGKTSIPDNVVRDGQNQAIIKVVLDDFTVTREFKDGKSTIRVSTNDGAVFTAPQSKLDTLFGKFTFDPLSFLKMSKAELFQTLSNITGYDRTKYETEKNIIYNSRTEVGRERDILKVKINELGEPTYDIYKIPDEEQSAKELNQKLQEAIRTNRSKEVLTSEIVTLETRKSDKLNEIEKLKEQIEIAEHAIEDCNSSIAYKQDLLKKLVIVNVEDITKEIEDLETLNRRIRDKQNRIKLENEYSEKVVEYDQRTYALDLLKEKALRELDELALPEGIRLTLEGEIEYNGIPIDNISQSEKIKLGLSLGEKSGHKFIFCKDASFLDSDNIKLIQQWAEEKDMQVFLERVEDETGDLIIEDGVEYDSKGNN